ncbi:MAG TPA: zinc metalloprotease HtpX [Acidimicrobiia bacterium]|nr:zinc metalloprotease HtpX [Acidimicrobiia bacterium]
MNNLKTVGLLAFMTTLLWLVAIALFPDGGFMIGLIFAVGFNLLAYFFSDKLALAASRAKPVTEEELPQVYAIVRRLALQTKMPEPRIYLIDSPQPNAFATGRSPRKAAVAVTTGILQVLTVDELEGVLAHELAHVRNRDILISSIAAMIAAALTMLARMAFWFGGGDNRESPLGAIGAILSLIVAPIAAMLIRLAISRTREFQADETGAEITGRPMVLASALEKISAGTAKIPMNVNPATAQLFIDNPMKAARGGGGMMRLLSTHPPTEERIERLTRIATGIR